MHFLDAGRHVLGPKLRVTVNGVPTELAGPVRFLPGKAPLEVGGVRYRGQVDVAVTGRKLDAVNHLGLEQYLFGVVPREMPSDWAEEALKAQAVAARSYALAHLVRGKPYDLYADVRSQVYGGLDGEHPRATAAVRATAGEVLLWDGRPIDALFHSTSGGATADVQEVFGAAVPYLVGVDDPWSSLSPVHRWGPTPVSEATLRKGLELRSPVRALKLTRAASGRVARVQVVTAAGTTIVSGATLRTAGALRSTWITQLASLTLTRPAGPALFGRPVTVTGKAAGIKGAVLSERVEGAWRPVGQPGVSFAVKRRLQAPAAFRLSVGKVAGPVLKVPVAPVVTAKASQLTVAGKVTPAEPGRTVQLQLDSGSGWATAAETTTDESGAYSLVLEQPGTYRARVAPEQGLAQGLSAPVELR
jgi:SpoIID/LytB domain protein